MTDLVERVARALCKSMCEEEVWPCWDTTEQECHCWDTQIPQARAAVLETLRGMMEPSEAVLRAGYDVMPKPPMRCSSTDFLRQYQAMLTQKIKEVEGDE